MNILVCVKQVPKEEDMKLDPVTRTLIRSQGTGVLSEYDAYALEMAVRLTEEDGGSVTVVSMGPPQAESVLRYCLSLGADHAVLLSDRTLAGADAYATATTLSAAVRHLENDGNRFALILCGQQASDSDTSLVMPELAEALGLPQVSFVKNYQFHEGSLCVTKLTDDGETLLELSLPAVMSVGKTDFEPRFPNIKRKLAANRAKIEVYDAAGLGLDVSEVGANGSRTIVGDSYFPERAKNCTEIMGQTTEEKVNAFLPILRSIIAR